MHNEREGQSLAEVLVAVAVGTILVVAAVTIIAPMLRGSTTLSNTQVAVAFGKELLENARVWSETDWHNIASVATSSTFYYFSSTSTPFVVATGTEYIAVATTTYLRYFYLEDVGRDAAGAIAAGGSYDPSTKKATVVYGWTSGPTSTMSSYFTRFRARVFEQTDWSGGAGVEGPVSSTGNRYATSSGINVSTTTGSIIINL